MTAQIVLVFSTQRFYINNDTDFEIGLSYKMYPALNSSNSLTEMIRLENHTAIAQTSKPLNVEVVGSDNILYTGTFSFRFTYDSKTGNLSVNGSPVALNTKTLINANVYPEAWVPQAVVGVGMSPLPFSQVKAIRSSVPGYVETFNSRINGGISDTLTLQTSKYGNNIQTNTKLSMYINYWQRKPDGTYDKTKEQVRLQVIYSAADFLNGVAGTAG
jgi:hypothetical protein